ncbi:MAG TPA: anaerobic ribonucleoside-triphosphate reductase [Candidatus Atribacteria bacterium]|nr:anaerobic ribonucleoside-triphosphate reductase [Candidatus Atribacteria bacterium]
MNITFKYNPEFERKMLELKSKYGETLFDIEGIGNQLDIDYFNKQFFDENVIGDISVDSNANVRSKHIGTYFSEVHKPFTRLNSIYVIWKEIAKEHGLNMANVFLEDQIKGTIYVHDLNSASAMPYCFSFTLERLVKDGLTFIDTIKSKPAKHADTFIQHIIQFVMFASNQMSGAIGLPDFFIWLWYFLKKDFGKEALKKEETKKRIHQLFQIFTYSINQPIRGSQQSPYVNVSFLDRNYIKAFFEDTKYPDNTKILDEIEYIIELQKMYWKWIAEERKIQMFTFPVMTANLMFENHDFVDKDSALFIAKHNLMWQDTNWYVSDSIDSISSCCRLINSTKTLNSFNINNETKLKGNVNSIGGSDLNIGSFKVVTINLPALVYIADGNFETFVTLLNEKLDIILITLNTIRNIIKEREQQGMLPLYTKKFMSLSRQYGTIGFTGIWEAVSLLGGTRYSFSGLNYTDGGKMMVDKILDMIKQKIEFGNKTFGFTFNTEQVPAEQAAVKMAQKDSLLYSNKRFYYPYKIYSNQWIPLIADTDMTNRIIASSKWDKEISGGAILHINLGSPLKDLNEYLALVKTIANNGVIYFAFNVIINVCVNGHSFVGTNVCPVCGQPKIDEFVRIVGYLVPRSSFNYVRREYEYPKRKYY